MQAKKPFGQNDNSYQSAGGFDGIKLLVDDFYQAMQNLPQAKTIRHMHQQDLTESADKLTRFLSGWLGGPRLYREKYGPIAIPHAHAHLDIDESAKQAWLDCMQQAIDQQAFDPEFKEYFMLQIAVPAGRCQNR